MDTTLTKFLITCLVCDLVGVTTGVPLKGQTSYQETSIRLKRSPANGFSLFGIKPPSFSIQTPVRSAQQTINSFSNFLTPASTNKNNDKPPATQGFPNERPIQKSPVNIPAIQNGNIDKNTVTLPPEKSVDTKTAVDKYDTSIANENKSVIHEVRDSNGDNHTSNKYGNDTNKKNVNGVEIDKSLLDEIFNDIRDSTTTEDVTVDWTTETGDYETTTSLDELLRIPAPVVASLLG